jgi:excisionase family DNA binding protein
MSGPAIRLHVPPEFVDAIAELVVPRVLAELRARERERERERQYLTVVEAADHLRAKPQRVYDLLSAGRLRRYKDGARVLVKRAELDAYIAGSGTRALTAHGPPRVA